MNQLLRRLAGFGGLPMISLITPLLVLPVIAHAAGKDGWASIVAGESIGTFAAIVIAYGWNTAGPPAIALNTDPAFRARLFRESMLVRVSIAVVAAPFIVALCLLLAADGFGLPTALMGLNGAVVGLSFSWHAVGAADPRSIAVLEAVPRVVAAVASAGIILATGWLAAYPLLAATASLVGVAVYGRKVLRGQGPSHVGLRDLWPLLVKGRGVAAIDTTGGAYATVPVPMVSALSPVGPAGAFASAYKLYQFGQFVPITLGNAFQAWTVEGPRSGRARRLKVALLVHALIGVVGAVVFALLAPTVSSLMFGADVAATYSVAAVLGVTFVLVSVRISMTRHVLIPAGDVRVVFGSTVAGAVVGIPMVALLVWALGPVGAALGLLAGEVAACGMQVAPTVRRMREAATLDDATKEGAR